MNRSVSGCLAARADATYLVLASWVGMLTNQFYDHAWVVTGIQWRGNDRFAEALDKPFQQRIQPQFRLKTLAEMARFLTGAADHWTTLDFPFGPSRVGVELLSATVMILKQEIEAEIGWDRVERFDHWQRLVLYSR